MLPLLGMCLVVGSGDLTGCQKARGDDFERFRPTEALAQAGAPPRTTLRYRPLPGADAIYQLEVWRRSSLARTRARMHLRVALHQEDAQAGSQFTLRLLTVLALAPEPPGEGLDLGPAHPLLSGYLSGRGRLDRLTATEALPSPINFVLVAPLLFPEYPEGAVGAGARWWVRRRVRWSRRQAADPLVRRPRYVGRTTALVKRHYALERFETRGERPVGVLAVTTEAQLRGRVETLGHVARQRGTLRGTGTVTVVRATGLPETMTLTLQGRYRLHSDDLKREVTEQVGITLRRERE